MQTKVPDGFHTLCDGLHQGAYQAVGENLDELAKYCLSFVKSDEHSNLKSFLANVLKTKSASELKGLINREKTDFYFNGHAAAHFLKAVLAAL